MIAQTDYAFAIAACTSFALVCYVSPVLGAAIGSAGGILLAKYASPKTVNLDEWCNAGNVEAVLFIQDAHGAKHALPDGALSEKWIGFFICKNQISENDFQEFEMYIKNNFFIPTTDSLLLGFSKRVGTAETSTNQQYPFIENDQFLCSFADVKRKGCVPGICNERFSDIYQKQVAAHNNKNHAASDEAGKAVQMPDCGKQTNVAEHKMPSEQLSSCHVSLHKDPVQSWHGSGMIRE